MSLRSVITLLMMADYLLMAAAGLISRPEQNSNVQIVTAGYEDHGHFERSLYMRMDGLEAFMAESFADTYQPATDVDNDQMPNLIHGIDSHITLSGFCMCIVGYTAEKKILPPWGPSCPDQLIFAVNSPPS